MEDVKSTREKIVQQKWAQLRILQEEYKKFNDFLYDVQVNVLKFSEPTWIQYAIGNFLQYGGNRIMIQAQRSQAKTTITAIFAVWCLIHDPTKRILVISAGDKKASEISTGIVLILKNFAPLSFMLPDKSQGDRSSTQSFDLHWALRGAGMNPSVNCLAINANSQGFRGDIIIPDDIESKANSGTAEAREKLLEITKDFGSIGGKGVNDEVARIIYLGTPQSVDSVYNTLEQRGYEVRIWTGRYPTEEEEEEYNGLLCPELVHRMKENPELRTGGGIMRDVGQPTDLRLDEPFLQLQELDQGKSWFKLQHMLSTELTDKNRYPLKLSDLCVIDLHEEKGFGDMDFLRKQELEVKLPTELGLRDPLYRPFKTDDYLHPYSFTYAFIDPAGGGENGDETGYAIIKVLHSYLYLVAWGGVKGGYEESTLKPICELLKYWQVDRLGIEKNFGGDAFNVILHPILRKIGYPLGEDDEITHVWHSTQKEQRIIDTLEPVMNRHQLIINENILKHDLDTIQDYPANSRLTYSGFYQMAKITREKGALIHDDRLDALEGAVAGCLKYINVDSEKLTKQKNDAIRLKNIFDPFGKRKKKAFQGNLIYGR